MLIIIYLILIIFESSVFIKKKKSGEFAVALVLFSIGFTLSVLQIAGVKVPNPNKGIEYLIKMLPPL
jgi:hypothetical protein